MQAEAEELMVLTTMALSKLVLVETAEELLEELVLAQAELEQ
jgi:hypothetical protein